MKSIITILTLICISTVSFSQDLNIQNNPYDAAPDITKERNAFKRERWFYEQRMYPRNYIPENVYANAYNQREQLRNSQGFFYGERNTWTNLGPTSGFYFTYGNISSRITTIKYDPVNPSVIYLGAAFGGVWKSVNGGNNWTAMTHDEVSLSSGSIAIDPNNTNIIY